METTEIKGYKRGSHLFFEWGEKKIAFDLKDSKFYRPLKNGQLKETPSGQAFFRKLDISNVADGFVDKAYASLIRKVKQNYNYNRLTNFASLFSNLEGHKHLEGYLLLGIDFTKTNVFTKPVSIYPKEVLEFMKESRITFSEIYWERNFEANPKLVTDLCTYVRRRYYLDLEVYRMVFNMVSSYSSTFSFFKLLTAPQEKEPTFENTYYNGRTIKETGYGCEYKTLFDYLVRIERTEACSFTSALTYYRDYLKMMREMERNKIISKMRETNPELDVTKIGYVGFGRIEKYPKYLRTRHDIVQKNYRDWQDEVDEKTFKANVKYGFEYSWGKYKMIAPRNSSDVRNEGTDLHHCVASYVSRIMDGTTQILFMREVAEESMVTVEVRAGSIVQARGYNNRSITDEENKWLKTFAKAKNLSYEDVKRNEAMPTPPVYALARYDADAAILRELSMMIREGA